MNLTNVGVSLSRRHCKTSL